MMKIFRRIILVLSTAFAWLCSAAALAIAFGSWLPIGDTDAAWLAAVYGFVFVCIAAGLIYFELDR